MVCSAPSSAQTADAAAIIDRMEEAYGRVGDYQTRVEARSFGTDGSVHVDRFLYTFRKPKSIRIDMETPHPGTILVYPDEEGKVFVRPGGRVRVFSLHLSTDSRLLRVFQGQRIDQTDMGLLIANIAHSLTDQRQGLMSITEGVGEVVIRVLALDHFRPAATVLYQFRIDKGFWLPVGVEKMTPAGRPESVVTFQDLRVNTGVTQAFFGTQGPKGG